jgi:hypothetical protein
MKMLRSSAFLSLVSSTIAFSNVGRFGARMAFSTQMMLKEGDPVPNVVFKARVRDESIGGSNPFTWKDVSSSDLFKGKRAVVFALPGGSQHFCICNIITISV